jgi:Flp pilus assembly protein TadG
MTATDHPNDAPARGEDGAAAVEFAIIVPLVLVILFGLIQYGFYFGAMQSGSAAAREAARRAAVGAPTACTTFRSEVSANIDGFETGGVSIKRDFADANSNAKVDVGEDVTVTVSFKSYDLNMPFVPFINDGRVTQKATARVDYLPDATIADCL